MEMNLGTRGATRQSWGRDSIRQFFNEIRLQHPKAGHDKLVRLMCDKAMEEREMLTAAMDYIVTNFTNAQDGYQRRDEAKARSSSSSYARSTITPEQKEEREKENERQRESIKNQIMLLNLPMANGKLARNCTGAELIKLGGAWVKLGKKIGSGKILGQVLNEEQVQEIYWS